ncbi:MAG: M20/M25/M40 family metallo-hydrolase [Anaerolineae bacterium]|nr:M20/M25/M40 family metallo-hydrolase [Anaerolineae bacterium]
MDLTTRTPEMIALLKELVDIGSPTHERTVVNRLGAIVARETKKLGAEIEIVSKSDVGDQIIARWGQGPGAILLIGHLDTVYPLGILASMPFKEKDDKIFGPGVLDMKSGLVITLTAIAALQEADQMPARPITAFYNTDEEAGSYESREIIEKLAKEAELALVHEPSDPEGDLLTWRKGTGKLKSRSRGVLPTLAANMKKVLMRLQSWRSISLPSKI